MSQPPSERVREYLGRRREPDAAVTPIQGDASSRSYFRVRFATGTEVLLVEATADPAALAPFQSNARFLDATGLGPPRILDEAPDLGLLALEDLGDLSLRRALEGAADPAARRALFALAVDALVLWQERATAALTPAVHAHGVRFDAAVFERELRMFGQRYLCDLRGRPLAATEARDLDAGIVWLAGELAGDQSVLTHRDYHIDNLLMTAGRLRVIDFQDARWGPNAYDLASLFNDRDVHRFIDPKTTAAELERFVARRGLDPARFDRGYRLAVAQRCLKAVGTFADQSLRRGRHDYLAFIEPSLGRARAAAAGFAALAPLVRLLD